MATRVLAILIVAASFLTGASYSARAQGSSTSSTSPTSSSAEDANAIKSALNAVNATIQTRVIEARDRIQGLWKRSGRLGPPQAPAFAAVEAVDPYAPGYDPFEALGYTQGMPTKARPMTVPSTPNYFVSIWGQGSYDHEHRSGVFGATNLNASINSTTGVVGADYVKIGVSSTSDAFLIGTLGSYTSSHTQAIIGDSVRTKTTGGGMYAAYINRGFSADISIIGAGSTSSGTGGGGVIAFNNRDTDSIVYSGNIQYKYDLSSTWWVEPTIGFSYTHSSVNTPLFTGGNERKIQGGARVGTELEYGTVKVTPSLTGLAYGSPEVEIPHASGTVFVGPTDKNYVWGKGIGKLNVQWTDKFSTNVEGEVRGRADVIGYAARLMARYTF